jgi:hypothetical protein
VKAGRPLTISRVFVAAISLALCGVGSAIAGDSGAAAVLRDGRIGYVLTNKYWAVYQTPDGTAECPLGFNTGPREQFALLFPDDGTKRTLLETQLARESEIYHPGISEEPYPFHEVAGNTAIGLDLDGKVDANDFTSPDGDQGIDNQLYRALGCVVGYRGPDGAFYHFSNVWLQRYGVNRLMIEITDVDSLADDDDVTVTTYRGLDSLLSDASGKGFVVGGTQRVDARWGKRFIQKFKGRIIDGILTTDTADLGIPWSEPFNTHTIQWMKDVRFNLRLTPERAEGLMGGYVDVDDWHRRLVRSLSTHHSSYGQSSAPSLYRALRRLADAYPDPETGKNTAVSAAAELTFTQVYIMHPEPDVETQEVASEEPDFEMRVGLR